MFCSQQWIKTDNSSDLYADSTLVGVSILLDDNPPVGADTDLHVIAMSPDAFYELSQCQIGRSS